MGVILDRMNRIDGMRDNGAATVRKRIQRVMRVSENRTTPLRSGLS